MCAKVTGPLYSISASGKLANAMVFFGWKGLNVVRQWVKPANPQSEDQGDMRLLLGGVGRAASAVKKTSDYEGQLISKELIPAGQTKQSYLVKKILDTFLYSAAQYEIVATAYGSHSAKAGFDSAAETLGLSPFDVEYKGTDTAFAGGMMVYLLAKLGTTLEFAGAPYTTALDSWTSTEITAMLADLSAAE